jgi:hypothetical protein
MPLREPIAVYTAANNPELFLVQDALIAAGIDAHITRDDSSVGLTVIGELSNVQKPQIWVEHADVERARPILASFEQRQLELSGTVGNTRIEDIVAECEECGRSSTFPATQFGSVQQCVHCFAFMDVGFDEDVDNWESEASEEEADQEKGGAGA